MRLGERLREVQKERSRIVERIRMKSQMTIFMDDARKSQESIMQEISYCQNI